MSANTLIEWAHASINFATGCQKVSPGCAHCYAEFSTHARVLRSRGIETWGPRGTRHPSASASESCRLWNRKFPASWKLAPGERPRVFANSASDWLDPAWPLPVLLALIKTIHDCEALDFLLLTKRPELFAVRLGALIQWMEPGPLVDFVATWRDGEPPKNAWVGASIENQEYADQRVPKLLDIPARIRFVSAEPILGPINFPGPKSLSGIDWAILGGESGKTCRECHIDWISLLAGYLIACKIPVFIKQLGAISTIHPALLCPMAWPEKTVFRPTPDNRFRIQLKHKKGGDPSEWPARLAALRQYPKPTP